MRKAFTLIELLVVITIIAILAAILFPVFASAKAAAKKASDLSNQKQIGTAIAIYLTDSDDVYPLTYYYSPDPSIGWGWKAPVETPADWDPKSVAKPGVVAAYQVGIYNSIQTYLKSTDIMLSPGGMRFSDPSLATSYAAALKTPIYQSYSINGLLNSWPASGVNRPSQLMMVSMFSGTISYRGAGWANPTMQCDHSTQPCVFQPHAPGCGPSVNGQFGYVAAFLPREGFAGNTNWVFSHGMNACMADTSAKFRKMGANINGKTDYHTDPGSQYDSNGNYGAWWFDPDFCQIQLFEPDFDFTNWGSPYEG